MREEFDSKINMFKNNYLSINDELNILFVGILEKNYVESFKEPNWNFKHIEIQDFEENISKPDNLNTIKENSFDIIISNQAFNNIDQFNSMNMHYQRILKIGGYLCIITPFHNQTNLDLQSIYHFSADGLISMNCCDNLKLIHSSIDTPNKYNILYEVCLILYKSINKSVENTSYYENNSQNYELDKSIIEKINLLKNRVEKIEKEKETIISSYKNTLNFLFLDCDIPPSKLLKYNHELSLELLKFLNNICNKYNIKWWLDGGNLLGAIRHEGFIPWDDDIDICMMRSDYEKFMSIINTELERNELTDIAIRDYREVNDKYVIAFTQFIYRSRSPSYNSVLAHIDIFIFDFTDEYSENTERIFNDERTKFYVDLLQGVDRNIALNNYFNNLNINQNKGKYIIPAIESYYGHGGDVPFKIFLYEDIFPLKEVKYENNIFLSPNNHKDYLKFIYGNSYMKIPTKFDNHNRQETFRTIEDIHEIFYENLCRLKKVNENFKKK